MNFAAVDAQSGGELILTPQNERLINGNILLSEDAAVTAAAFEVTGEQGFAFSLTLPTGNHFLTNGKKQMVIKNFTSNFSSIHLNGGKSAVAVGATLEVNPQQEPGYYSTASPLQVTVNYN